MMHRRFLLATSLGVLAAPALAQQGRSGAAEADHARTTKRLGATALATSRLALKKSQSAAIREFAAFETAEQEILSDVLGSMEDSATTGATGSVNAPDDATLATQLDAEGKELLAQLQRLNGTDFDRAFVKGQIDGHEKLLEAQEAYLKHGGSRERVAIAKLSRGKIKEHLTLLGHLGKS